MQSRKIIIIEEEIIIAIEMQMRIEEMGHKVIAIAKSAYEGVKLASEKHPDLVITEIMFHGSMDGIEAAAAIARDLKIPILFLTTLSFLREDPKILAIQPVNFLVKPIKTEELCEAIINNAFLESE